MRASAVDRHLTLNKGIHEMTEEELRQRLGEIRDDRKISKDIPKTARKRKTQQEKLRDQLSKLSPDQLKALLEG